MVETEPPRPQRPRPGELRPGVSGEPGRPQALPSVRAEASLAAPLGLGELDRVLSGGLVPGSVTLVGGEPGIGKSTLVLQAATSAAERGLRSLVVAAEESVEQVRRRAERLGALSEECFLFSTGDVLAAIEAADGVAPGLLVIDSIQAVSDGASTSPAGSSNQVRDCAQLLAQYARATGTATILVGHVTKDGNLAGPRTLEHLVDTVVYFEGDRHHALRTLVAVKHRYGAAGELGFFEMGESGLVSLDDPSALFLSDRLGGLPGSATLPALEGRRPLLVELQALLVPGHGPQARRVVQGASSSRVAILLAVLERCCGVLIGPVDVFVSSVGGLKVSEPAADLAIGLAIASSLAGRPLPGDVTCFGEVGLNGEVRQVSRPERRLAEAERLGFKRAVVPRGTPAGSGSIAIEPVSSLTEALYLFGLVSREGSSDHPAGLERAALVG
jgi:DNA repair protein RadA/Sms